MNNTEAELENYVDQISTNPEYNTLYDIVREIFNLGYRTAISDARREDFD